MSIISSEAERFYPRDCYPGYEDADRFGCTGLRYDYTSEDVQEAYMAGRERQPTDEEIEAGAKALAYAIAFDANEPEETHPMTAEQVWDVQDEETRQYLSGMVNAMVHEMQGKATEE